MFKCPYCSISKPSWEKVKTHSAVCLKSDRTHIVCTFYGPLALSDLNKFDNARAIKKAYPNITFTAKYFRGLRKTNNNFHPAKRLTWSREDLIESIRKFFFLNKRIPQCNDFLYTTEYPSYQTVINHFGSWNSGILASGLVPSLNKGFGVKTTALDGIEYDSISEAYFVDNFLFNKYSYEYYTPYGNGWFYDFYIKELDLYIELDGGFTGEYREKMEQKVEYNKKMNRKLLVVSITTIYKPGLTLSSLLLD